MNDEDYLNKLKELSQALLIASKARPYDPNAYNAIIDRLNNLYTPNGHRRRRRPWPALITVIMLLIILMWIVYSILTLLYMRGSQ